VLVAATVLLMAGGSLAVGGLQPDVPLHLRTVADARPTPVLSAAAQGASDGNADDEDRLLRQLGRQSMINARRTAEKAARDRRAAAARRVAASRVLAARASRDHARAALAVADSYARPTSGPLTQPYGSHPGIDLAPPYGTPVVAAHAGVVAFVGEQDGYGNHVEVTLPGGYLITYSHLSAFSVAVGQAVLAGAPLGAVGSTGLSTGPHLHFEVMLPGRVRTDPAAWLMAHGISV